MQKIALLLAAARVKGHKDVDVDLTLTLLLWFPLGLIRRVYIQLLGSLWPRPSSLSFRSAPGFVEDHG